MPGYKNSMASDIRWAEECQNECFASASSHLWSFSVASLLIGLMRSHISPFTVAAYTSLANLGLICSATSRLLIPLLYSLADPSGKVIFIILNTSFYWSAKIIIIL